ncbi:apurinic-apyrimidinic endonuclease 1 [Trichomonascus vanleenenianus]|uniref:DNA-(apurinic or apyrimidinic site) lyase APN1 n=1 Tax=Trichomonascus vanleenenianus TaxID=2268995 RepID=UPI003ECB76BE
MPPKKITKEFRTFTRLSQPKHFVGAHVSTADGVEDTIVRTARMGGNAFALFLKNQRRWTQKPHDQKNVDAFHANLKEYNFDPLKHILPHSSYIINLGNPDKEKRAKAIECFQDDLERCERLGIGLYNIHPGSTLGTDKDETIKRIADGINAAHKETKFVKVVLENMAGQGNVIGSVLEDLKKIIEHIEDKSRIGVCIDTCHAFASGYDLRTEEVFDKFWHQFDEIVGMKYLSGMHLNDSKAPFDSKRDLHQNIGLGFLGLEPFRLIMNRSEFEGLPLILETPLESEGSPNDDCRGDEIKLLEWLIGRSSDDEGYLAKAKELQVKGAKERQEHQAKFDTKQKKSAAKNNRTIDFAAKDESKPKRAKRS